MTRLFQHIFVYQVRNKIIWKLESHQYKKIKENISLHDTPKKACLYVNTHTHALIKSEQNDIILELTGFPISVL